ncbi:hypothetical protein HBB16_12170 [Pseudonocardia sp. MCCB 268]|nr:hypothetical protein [Pseudonocardia cytotoxica]
MAWPLPHRLPGWRPPCAGGRRAGLRPRSGGSRSRCTASPRCCTCAGAGGSYGRRRRVGGPARPGTAVGLVVRAGCSTARPDPPDAGAGAVYLAAVTGLVACIEGALGATLAVGLLAGLATPPRARRFVAGALIRPDAAGARREPLRLRAISLETFFVLGPHFSRAPGRESDAVTRGPHSSSRRPPSWSGTTWFALTAAVRRRSSRIPRGAGGRIAGPQAGLLGVFRRPAADGRGGVAEFGLVIGSAESGDARGRPVRQAPAASGDLLSRGRWCRCWPGCSTGCGPGRGRCLRLRCCSVASPLLVTVMGLLSPLGSLVASAEIMMVARALITAGHRALAGCGADGAHGLGHRGVQLDGHGAVLGSRPGRPPQSDDRRGRADGCTRPVKCWGCWPPGCCGCAAARSPPRTRHAGPPAAASRLGGAPSPPHSRKRNPWRPPTPHSHGTHDPPTPHSWSRSPVAWDFCSMKWVH